MESISPIFVSTNRQQWIIAYYNGESVCWICSSIKVKNAIGKFTAPPLKIFYHRELAHIINGPLRKMTGKGLEKIPLCDGKGNFLVISEILKAEHTFEPTPEPGRAETIKLIKNRIEMEAKLRVPGE